MHGFIEEIQNCGTLSEYQKFKYWSNEVHEVVKFFGKEVV